MSVSRTTTWVKPALLGAALWALAGGAAAQRLSLEGLQQQLNAKIALSDLVACAANDTVVRVGGVWKCKSTLPRFVDNGNGTVTDNKTGLMWEQKVTCGAANYANPRCVENIYSWSSAAPYIDPTGTLYTSFLPALNDLGAQGAGNGLGGYADWRIPSVGELRSITTGPTGPAGPGFACGGKPCIDSVFGATQASTYWSSTSWANDNSHAWLLSFNFGAIRDGVKPFPTYVRAVRGGGS